MLHGISPHSLATVSICAMCQKVNSKIMGEKATGWLLLIFLSLTASEYTARYLIPKSMPIPSLLSVSLQSGNQARCFFCSHHRTDRQCFCRRCLPRTGLWHERTSGQATGCRKNDPYDCPVSVIKAQRNKQADSFYNIIIDFAFDLHNLSHFASAFSKRWRFLIIYSPICVSSTLSFSLLLLPYVCKSISAIFINVS